MSFFEGQNSSDSSKSTSSWSDDDGVMAGLEEAVHLFTNLKPPSSSDEDVETSELPPSSSDEDVETSELPPSSSDEDVETSELLPPSREERLQMFMDSFNEKQRFLFGGPEDDNTIDEEGCHSMSFREFCSHELDMMESGGFDIQDYSMVNDSGVMLRFHYPPDKPTCAQSLAELKCCSRLAIKHYNNAQETKFRYVDVIKANVEPLCPYRYYITFEATDENNNSQTFQARVNVDFPTMKKEVELVRIKTAPDLYIPTGNANVCSEC